MTTRPTRRRRFAALAVAAALAATLTGCVAPVVDGSTPGDAPTSADAAPPTGEASPAPGRTIAATPPADVAALRGVRIAAVVPDDGPATRVLRDALRGFARTHGLELEEFAAAADAASLETAFAEAVTREPHVVVGLGAGDVDVFAYGSSQVLDQDFLLLGAQLAEPTANVTAVVWEGATSRGSGAPADGELDDAAVTGVRATEAAAAGLSAVMSGVSGVVLHLAGETRGGPPIPEARQAAFTSPPTGGHPRPGA